MTEDSTEHGFQYDERSRSFLTPWGTRLFTVPVYVSAYGGKKPQTHTQEQEAEDLPSIRSPETSSDSEESPPG